jgi:hypothetical protein
VSFANNQVNFPITYSTFITNNVRALINTDTALDKASARLFIFAT